MARFWELCYRMRMSEEVVLFRGSPSLVVKAGTFVIGLFLIAGFAAGAAMLHQPLVAIGSIAVILYLLGVAIFIRNQVFEITSQRVRWTRGILTKRTDEMELYRVTDVTLVEPLLMRMVGAGNIEITSSDSSTPRLTLPAVKEAKRLREQLRTSIEECRSNKGVRVTEFERGDGPAA